MKGILARYLADDHDRLDATRRAFARAGYEFEETDTFPAI